MEQQAQPYQRLTEEQVRQRHRRSIAIAIALVGLVILFFVMTLVRLGGNVADRAF